LKVFFSNRSPVVTAAVIMRQDKQPVSFIVCGNRQVAPARFAA
jgi:hypothetical protein